MIGLWFVLGTIGMGLGTVALAAGIRQVPEENRGRYAILIAVPLIAVVAYALMALGIGGIGTDSGTVYIPRYVDWLVTTPMHILYIGLFAGVATNLLGRAVGLQALTILFGLGGALVASPLNWILFAAGGLAFAVVVYDAFNNFDDAAARTLRDDQYALFRQLRAFLVVLWLVYPVIWVLGGPGLGFVDTETAALVVAYLDVVSKVGLGLIALNHWVGAGVETGETVEADVTVAD